MKIYIDELPKSCAECKLLGIFRWCYLKDSVCDEIKNNKRHVLCPLKPLSDYTKQVRKEVVEEIKEKFNKKALYVKIDGLYSYVKAIKFDNINKILNQVKGETK